MIAVAPERGRRTGPDHVIVARDYGELLQALRVAVAARRNVTVVLDRRQAERRQRVQPVREERRRGERRSRPLSPADPCRLPHVLSVRQRDRAPSE